jgi:hypothetical protein
MYYKIIILVIITLFIGANLLCGCCMYPIFDMITGKSSCSASKAESVKEGNANLNKSDAGAPGSTQSVERAKQDIIDVSSKAVPALVQSVNDTSAKKTEDKKLGFMNIGDLSSVINTALGGSGSGSGGAQPRQGVITTGTKEGMTTLGSDVNEIQNSDVAGMWVTKANTYASEFGYGTLNNAGAAYTADEPLKNGELVIFAKNKSKPECCPSPYSTSTGCVCMTPEQINYLNTRGGNRTSDSGV